MAKLNQEEIAKVYAEVQRRAAVDLDFRKEMLDDPRAAITKLAGKDLPQTFIVKVIENDPAYDATFVLPDLIGDEMDLDDLDNVAGGVSILLAVSACGVAITPVPCPADVCAAAIGK